jgi:hypothetical protein
MHGLLRTEVKGRGVLGLRFRHALRSPSLYELLFFLGILFFYACTFKGNAVCGDNLAQFYHAKQMVEHRSMAFETVPEEQLRDSFILGRDGKYYQRHFLAHSFVTMPLCILIDHIVPHDLPNRENRLFRLWSLNAVLLTSIIVFVTYKVLSLLSSSSISRKILILSMTISTPFWMYSDLCFNSLTETMFLVLCFYALLLDSRLSTGNTWFWPTMAGLCFGLAVATRPTCMLTLPAFLLVLEQGSRAGRRLARLVWFLVPVAVLVALVLLLNMMRFGHPFSFGYDNEHFSTPWIVGISGIIFSPAYSFVYFSPVLILGLIAVFASIIKMHRLGISILLFMLPYVVLMPCWWAWWGGGSELFVRFLLPVIPFLFFAMALCYNWLFESAVKYLVIVIFSIMLLLGAYHQYLSANTYGNLVNFYASEILYPSGGNTDTFIILKNNVIKSMITTKNVRVPFIELLLGDTVIAFAQMRMISTHKAGYLFFQGSTDPFKRSVCGLVVLLVCLFGGGIVERRLPSRDAICSA